MSALKELAIKHNCVQTKDPFDHYFGVYHRHFDNLRNNVTNLLEIGVQTGASLCMWKDFFQMLLYMVLI